MKIFCGCFPNWDFRGFSLKKGAACIVSVLCRRRRCIRNVWTIWWRFWPRLGTTTHRFDSLSKENVPPPPSRKSKTSRKQVLWIRNELVRIRILLLMSFWIRIRNLPFTPGQINSFQTLSGPYIMGTLSKHFIYFLKKYVSKDEYF